MTLSSNSPDRLDKLKARLQALLAKTIENGCTENEALSAAAKVAELLDRHDLSLTDIEIQEAPCERLAFEPSRKKRIPLDGCIGAIAEFCDCRAWRERSASGQLRYVFFGLPADATAARHLTELVDAAVRSELGRYKTSLEYQGFRHNERHMANASFALGMVDSIAGKLIAMKAARDRAIHADGRDLTILKTSLVDQELAKLGVQLHPVEGGGRMVSIAAYDAGGTAGEAFTVEDAIGTR
ncbi:MAG TPA: DUF2786 domain-containing protein [Aliidongia sp.]|nr:DUF2786 domain-containing protein [Aliidongia sp.]